MVPDRLISTAGEHLRSGVRAASPLAGGYTPQQALRLLLEDGTTAVLKVAPPHIEDAPGPVWPEILCREIEAYRNLDMLRRMPVS